MPLKTVSFFLINASDYIKLTTCTAVNTLYTCLKKVVITFLTKKMTAYTIPPIIAVLSFSFY